MKFFLSVRVNPRLMILLSNFGGIGFRLGQNRKQKVFQNDIKFGTSEQFLNQNQTTVTQKRSFDLFEESSNEKGKFDEFLKSKSKYLGSNLLLKGNKTDHSEAKESSEKTSDERNFVSDFISIIDRPLKVFLISSPN